MAALPELVFWDSGGWTEWLSQLLHPSGGGGSYIQELVGLRSQSLGFVSSIQHCLEGNHSVSMASSSVWGDPEFLRGWRRATFPYCHLGSRASVWISGALSSSRKLISSLVYSCFLSSFHRQAHQEHFLKNPMNKHHCPSLYSGLSPINFNCSFSNVNWSLIFFFFLLYCNSLLQNPSLKCSVLSHLAAPGHVGESGAPLRRVFCGCWELVPHEICLVMHL